MNSEKMKLKLGMMTNKELAQWFGVSEGTFRNSKKSKLKELEYFASFEEVKGKVNIKEIYFNTYSKQGSKNYQKVKDVIDEVWNQETGLDSCARVGMEIKEKFGESLPLTERTIYDYTRKGRNELYGRPFLDAGTLGKCSYTWCKKEGEGVAAEYRLLTDEEEKVKKELLKKYFGDSDEKHAIVQAMVERGEIKKEEAWEVFNDLTGTSTGSFMMFLGELQEKLGCQVVRGTLVERNNKLIEETAF